MLDDITDIDDFYSGNPDAEQERLGQHQLEYDLTWRYLNKYLPPEGHILEVGAATGRYTMELAKRGYMVTAVDLSAALIDKCRQDLAAEGLDSRVHLVVADARDLVQITKTDFDAVLLMGPLYHLIEGPDRRLALNEAISRLRSGGVIFSAFLSRYGIFGDMIKLNPMWINDKEYVDLFLENGTRPKSIPRGGFRAYFARPEEIVPFHEALGIKSLSLAGIEPAISADDDSYNRLGQEQRRLWLDLLFEISANESTLGASRHLLYVGQKPQD